MIASDTATVGELNRRARADRVAAGEVTPGGATLGDGGVVGLGDQIVTRHNDRSLGSNGRWVRNGDCWTVTGVDADGTLTARHTTGGQAIHLPAAYVAEHVELAYAVTAHRCQGRTVDTAHTFASVRTTRETLYVSATRGRSGNHIYVDTTSDPDPETGHDNGSAIPSGRDVLVAVLGNSGADISAHEAIRRTHDRAESMATIAAEHQTIASAADHRDEDTAWALVERQVSMERRADSLAEGAIADRKAWVRQLGRPPSEPADRQEWLRNVATVAAYRDRWSIHSPTKPFGDVPTQPMGADQALQLRQAIAAARRARSAYWRSQEPEALGLTATTSSRQQPGGVDL